MPTLAERCEGRWRSLLPLLGVSPRFLTGKHGPCPMCGGKDRWRFIDRRGSGDWFCTHCGHGSGIDLAKLMLKSGFRDVACRIEELLGETRVEVRRRVADEGGTMQAMIELWEAGTAVASGDAVATYLARRGLPLSRLRERVPSVCEAGEGSAAARSARAGAPLSLTLPSRSATGPSLSREAGEGDCIRSLAHARYDAARSFPAMLAAVTSPEGHLAQLHRTFLDGHGAKAPVEPARKLMPGTLPPGSAVRLAPASAHLGLAEGIETALSAMILFAHPVWAALHAGNLERFAVPDGVTRLTIYADHDESFTGQAAAFALARRLTGKLAVEVKTPVLMGLD